MFDCRIFGFVWFWFFLEWYIPVYILYWCISSGLFYIMLSWNPGKDARTYSYKVRYIRTWSAENSTDSWGVPYEKIWMYFGWTSGGRGKYWMKKPACVVLALWHFFLFFWDDVIQLSMSTYGCLKTAWPMLPRAEICRLQALLCMAVVRGEGRAPEVNVSKSTRLNKLENKLENTHIHIIYTYILLVTNSRSTVDPC